MRKHILAIVFCAAPFVLSAQIWVHLGGGVDKNRTIDTRDPLNSSAQLAVGYTSGRFTQGLQFLYSGTKTGNYIRNVDYRRSLSAFSRFTFIKKNYLGVWAEGALGYFNNFKTYNADHALPVERSTQGGLVSIRPGLVFYATRHLQIEMSCGTILYQLGQSEYTNFRYPFTTNRTVEHKTEASLSNALNVAVNWQF